MTTIRPMQPADKEAVLAMMEVFYASPAVLSNGSAAIFSSDFEACINNNPYLEGYMFEENGQIQGYAMAAKSFSTEFGRPCIWVEDLYIKEDFRGTGIGSLFLEFIEKKYPEAYKILTEHYCDEPSEDVFNPYDHEDEIDNCDDPAVYDYNYKDYDH